MLELEPVPPVLVEGLELQALAVELALSGPQEEVAEGPDLLVEQLEPVGAAE